MLNKNNMNITIFRLNKSVNIISQFQTVQIALGPLTISKIKEESHFYLKLKFNLLWKKKTTVTHQHRKMML